MAYRYRDRRTGMFVAKDSWDLGRLTGSHRYVRETVEERDELEPIDDIDEWERRFEEAEDYEPEREATGNADSPGEE